MGRRYELLDVFTDTPFGGNPLAVFLDGGGLDPGVMQAVAAELNLSETVFLAPEAPGEWRARIFTPAVELPFAGHPTIGAALALHRAGRLGGTAGVVLHEGVGPVPVTIDPDGARFRVPAAAEVREALPSPLLADLLGLPPDAIRTGVWRPRAVSCGVSFHLVALTNPAAVAAARLRVDRWQAHLAGHWAPHVYIFAAGPTAGNADIHARMFAPAMGVMEDPATGGAAAALAAFLAAAEPARAGRRTCVVAQGIEMGRPSRIVVGFDADGGIARTIDIAGAAVTLGFGYLGILPDDTAREETERC